MAQCCSETGGTRYQGSSIPQGTPELWSMAGLVYNNSKWQVNERLFAKAFNNTLFVSDLSVPNVGF